MLMLLGYIHHNSFKGPQTLKTVRIKNSNIFVAMLKRSLPNMVRLKNSLDTKLRLMQ